VNGGRRRPSWGERADAVRSLPLEEILSLCGGQRDRRDRCRWLTDRGPISLTGSLFMNWREQAGGDGAVDLAIHLLELSFKDAVEWLERQFLPATHAAYPTDSAASSVSGSAGPASVSSRLARPLHLPSPAAGKLADVCHYLTDQRHLRRELVGALVQRNALYADARGNAVFVMERGKSRTPVGAELRGTTASKWRGLAPGSRKDAGYFWVGQQSASRVVLCESAIDAISCYQLLGACICISTAGARADIRWLPTLLKRGYEVHNGFDDDDAGHAAARAMQRAYPLIQRLSPPAKDWNAALHRW
jgi:hypothetical protein